MSIFFNIDSNQQYFAPYISEEKIIKIVEGLTESQTEEVNRVLNTLADAKKDIQSYKDSINTKKTNATTAKDNAVTEKNKANDAKNSALILQGLYSKDNVYNIDVKTDLTAEVVKANAAAARANTYKTAADTHCTAINGLKQNLDASFVIGENAYNSFIGLIDEDGKRTDQENKWFLTASADYISIQNLQTEATKLKTDADAICTTATEAATNAGTLARDAATYEKATDNIVRNQNLLESAKEKYENMKDLYNREVLHFFNMSIGIAGLMYYVYKNQDAVPNIFM